MIRLIKALPFYAVLLSPLLVFILHSYNYQHVSFSSTHRSYAVCFALSVIVFFAYYLLLKKNLHPAGTLTAFTMILLFFYGFIYGVLEKLYYKGLWPFSEIHRYLIIVFLLLIALLGYFLVTKKRSFQSITLYGNYFFLILLFINLFNWIGKNHDAPITVADKIKTMQAVRAHDSMPDIYYIVLDGYANDSILSVNYSYPQNPLTGYLQNKLFYIASDSKTNYIATSPSLSSSLNYHYLDSLPSETNLVYHNRVSDYLKKKGYKIIHARSGYTVSRENYDADTILSLNNLNEFERTLLKFTILRIDETLGYIHYLTLKEQLSVIQNVPKIKGPKYFFLHIVSPHPPYVCDEEGNFKSGKKISSVWWEPKSDYLSQLKYINKEVIAFVQVILKESSHPPILLLQSDHGPWIASDHFNSIYQARSKILNAYLVPDTWKKDLYPSITPVNSFRVIFNNLFNDSMPLLKDIPLDSTTTQRQLPQNLLLKKDI
jgi:hypothetical protein